MVESKAMGGGQLVVFEDKEMSVAVPSKAKRGGRRAPLKALPVAYNRAAAARAAAAKEKVEAAERRARAVREHLRGGGWCQASQKPSWVDHDARILRKLEEKQADPSSGSGDAAEAGAEGVGSSGAEADAQVVCEKAWDLLDEWERVAEAEGEVRATGAEVALLRKALESGLGGRSEKAPRPPTLAEARAMLKSAVERLMAGDTSVENEVEKLDQLVQSHPEFVAEREAERKAWDDAQREANAAALRTLRRAVPPDVATRTRSSLEAELPAAVARRVFTKRVLHLVRAPPSRIAKLHVVQLRGALDTSGLDLDEARAVYAALPGSWENDADGDKAAWAEALREKLVDLVKNTRDSDDRPSRYAGVDAYDTLDPPEEAPDAAVRSGINDGAADRARELDCLRAARKQGKQLAAVFGAHDAGPKPLRVTLHSPRPRKSPNLRRTQRPPHPAIFSAAAGGGLMDQLKAKLRARNQANEAAAEEKN